MSSERPSLEASACLGAKPRGVTPKDSTSKRSVSATTLSNRGLGQVDRIGLPPEYRAAMAKPVKRLSSPSTAERQPDAMVDRSIPAVAKAARRAIAKMRQLAPGAVELVYDNYNALAIGFAPGERSSEGIFSIAPYPPHVSLFFLQGAKAVRSDRALERPRPRRDRDGGRARCLRRAASDSPRAGARQGSAAGRARTKDDHRGGLSETKAAETEDAPGNVS